MSTRGRETITAISTIMRDPTLTPELKTLWALYRCYDHKGKGAWPGDQTLADHMDKSPRSVQGYRAELLRRGYLEQQKRGPRPAVYRAVVPDAPIPQPEPRRTSWESFGVDSAEEVVRALEQMIRLYKRGGIEEIPYEMMDTWSEVWDNLAWPPIADLLNGNGRKGARDWTAIRAELHRQLNSNFMASRLTA